MVYVADAAPNVDGKPCTFSKKTEANRWYFWRDPQEGNRRLWYAGGQSGRQIRAQVDALRGRAQKEGFEIIQYDPTGPPLVAEPFRIHAPEETPATATPERLKGTRARAAAGPSHPTVQSPSATSSRGRALKPSAKAQPHQSEKEPDDPQHVAPRKTSAAMPLSPRRPTAERKRPTEHGKGAAATAQVAARSSSAPPRARPSPGTARVSFADTTDDGAPVQPQAAAGKKRGKAPAEGGQLPRTSSLDLPPLRADGAVPPLAPASPPSPATDAEPPWPPLMFDGSPPSPATDAEPPWPPLMFDGSSIPKKLMQPRFFASPDRHKDGKEVSPVLHDCTIVYSPIPQFAAETPAETRRAYDLRLEHTRHFMIESAKLYRILLFKKILVELHAGAELGDDKGGPHGQQAGRFRARRTFENLKGFLRALLETCAKPDPQVEHRIAILKRGKQSHEYNMGYTGKQVVGGGGSSNLIPSLLVD